MGIKETPSQKYDWLYFIGLSGGDGARWVRSFEEVGGPELTNQIDRAVGSLRVRKPEVGLGLLKKSRAQIDDIYGACPISVIHVLERWYCSALAYRYYCNDNFDEARKALGCADDSVKAALTCEPFLILLAGHCYDFRLQRARIERNARCWAEMNRQFDVARAMLRNKVPLCILDSGKGLYIQEVDELYRSLPRTEEERFAVSLLVDSDKRRVEVESVIRGSYLIPGFVIPYP